MVGERIKALRVDAGWSQAELARKAKLGVATISRIERDPDYNPTRDSLESIAKALGTSFEFLVGHVVDQHLHPRSAEVMQTGFMLAAFQRLTMQLNNLIQAHQDLANSMEGLLAIQGWKGPKEGGIGDLSIPVSEGGNIARGYVAGYSHPEQGAPLEKD